MTGRRWLRAWVGGRGGRTALVRPRLEALEDRLAPATWGPQTSGTTQPLLGLWGDTSTNDIFAVGGGGTILHSLNDGANWGADTSGTTQLLYGVWGSDYQNIFAVGSNGTILNSGDDGRDWVATALGDNAVPRRRLGERPQRRLRRRRCWHDPALHKRCVLDSQNPGTTQDLYGVWGAAPTMSSPWAPTARSCTPSTTAPPGSS